MPIPNRNITKKYFSSKTVAPVLFSKKSHSILAVCPLLCPIIFFYYIQNLPGLCKLDF